MAKTTDTTTKYGLSRKTNIAIAGIAGIASSQTSPRGIIAISVIVLVALTYQFILDYMGKRE